jgi:hypothetical protein
VDQETAQRVAFRAERDGQVLSWDTHPVMAQALKLQLEAEGWEVSISTDEGPRRRLTPRIDRAHFVWAHQQTGPDARI